MISVGSSVATHTEAPSAHPVKERRASRGREPGVLADIYRDDVNIAIWQRELSNDVRDAATTFARSNRSFSSAMTVSPDDALSAITDALGANTPDALRSGIAELVDMFCCLLGLKRAGLRVSVLSEAMCPKFHVDRVPCRLITTYQGAGTEWLQHAAVDRTKLGPGSGGLSDLESGLIESQSDIEQLEDGDVALLKGELWQGNEDAGLVHRSPAVPAGDARLLVTVDVSR